MILGIVKSKKTQGKSPKICRFKKTFLYFLSLFRITKLWTQKLTSFSLKKLWTQKTHAGFLFYKTLDTIFSKKYFYNFGQKFYKKVILNFFDFWCQKWSILAKFRKIFRSVEAYFHAVKQTSKSILGPNVDWILLSVF